MVLASNLNQLMKILALPEPMQRRRLKALRFHIIGVAGRMVKHGRQLFIKLAGGADTFLLFQAIRENIAGLTMRCLHERDAGGGFDHPNHPISVVRICSS